MRIVGGKAVHLDGQVGVEFEADDVRNRTGEFDRKLGSVLEAGENGGGAEGRFGGVGEIWVSWRVDFRLWKMALF